MLLFIWWLTDHCFGWKWICFVASPLKLFRVGSYSLTNDALKWLPHHQLLTSLSFALEPNGDNDTREQWIQKHELFTIAIRLLPHLQHLHLQIGQLYNDDRDEPFITITSSSLRKLRLETRRHPHTILDLPSLTDLDISWLSETSLNAQEMTDMFVNCKNVTYLSFRCSLDTTMIVPWHLFAPNMITLFYSHQT
jgi:hypothetical protein